MTGWFRVQLVRELGLIFILALVLLFFGSQIDNYFQPNTFRRISGEVALIAVVAAGQVFVVITRNVDLSVASIIGFTAFFVGRQLMLNPDMSPAVAVAIAISVGAGFGLINGLIVAYGGVPAIVATLGTLALFRGLLVMYSDSLDLLLIGKRDLPDWISRDLVPNTVVMIGELELRSLPFIALIMILISQAILSYTSFGRRLYAVGSSPEAATMAGIPSRRLVATTFVISGALAGLGGLFFLAQAPSVTTTAARMRELDVVAAVVVGGVNIFGGSGTAFGAMLGAVLIGTIEYSLRRMQINEFWKDAMLGVFILAAVAADTVLFASLRNWWANLRHGGRDDAQNGPGDNIPSSVDARSAVVEDAQ